MTKKITLTLIVVLSVFFGIALFFVLNVNTNTKVYFTVLYGVYIPNNHYREVDMILYNNNTHAMTLYNCRIEITYVTTSNINKTITHNLGIVEWKSFDINIPLDDDFKSNGEMLGLIWVEHNVMVRAYGYTKP